MIQKAIGVLSNIDLWTKVNGLKINSEKTKCVLFRPRSRQISYSFQRTLGSSTVKALGVLFTESLSWNEHHEYVHTKASKSVGLLCRNRYIFPKSVKLLLYYSLVYTHYVYCHLVWGQTTKHNLTRLLLTQKRAIRIVSNVSFLHPSKELFFKHPVIPIEQLHRFRLLVTYNVALKHNNTFFHFCIVMFN